MKKQNLKIGTMLIWNPTNEPFRIVGINTKKVNDGTIEKVTGIDKEGLCSVYNLAKCSLSNDISLMY